MTANQINFAKLQEDIRHNRATEGEQARHNVEDERIRSDTNAVSRETLAETVRHNVQTEAINAEHYGRMDTETSRSNLAREFETHRTNVAQETERERSNRASEQISISELEETARHNKATEKETKRHNKAEEKIGTTQAKAATSQAATAAKNADTRYYEYLVNKYHSELQVANWSASILISQRELDELERHNQVMEVETERHNREGELNEWNRNQNTFINSPGGSSQANVNSAMVVSEKAKATQLLAQAGYLRTQEEWYAWNQIVNTAVNITQALKNFSSAIPGTVPVINALTK